MIRNVLRAAMLCAPLALAACAGADAGPVTAERQASAQSRAVVQSVDQVTRQVILRLEDGAVETFTAGPEVRNLAQLEAGDTVVVTVEEVMSVRLARPGDVVATTTALVADRAPEGERPGAAAISGLASVVTFVSYDPATATATFTTPSGETMSRVIAPEMREFAAARSAGEQIYVEMFDLVAVGVEEVGS
jgi:hypothetical protein